MTSISYPSTKYSTDESTAAPATSNMSANSPSTSNQTEVVEPLQFFNYNEFLVKDYGQVNAAPSDSHSSTDHPSLVINHFPNHYVSQDSLLYTSTRIVRIPRIYDTIPNSDLVPQFSTCVPGNEPAALKSEAEEGFEISGIYDKNLFGLSSMTPLVPDLLTASTFTDIVKTLNRMLLEALDPNSALHVMEGVLDIITIGLYSNIYCKYIQQTSSKRKLLELEDYIENELNQGILKDTDVEVISLRKSGYLTLDFQIPKPKLEA